MRRFVRIGPGTYSQYWGSGRFDSANLSLCYHFSTVQLRLSEDIGSIGTLDPLDVPLLILGEVQRVERSVIGENYLQGIHFREHAFPVGHR